MQVSPKTGKLAIAADVPSYHCELPQAANQSPVRTEAEPAHRRERVLRAVRALAMKDRLVITHGGNACTASW